MLDGAVEEGRVSKATLALFERLAALTHLVQRCARAQSRSLTGSAAAKPSSVEREEGAGGERTSGWNHSCEQSFSKACPCNTSATAAKSFVPFSKTLCAMRTRWIVDVEARTAESSGVRSDDAGVEEAIVEQVRLEKSNLSE